MNETPMISFILPAFNAEKTIERALRSVLNTDTDDIEVIVIDDGSTDATGSLCDKLAVCYEQLRVVHQCNAGRSFSRNKGLRIARGKWISFVDADDYLVEGAVDSMLRDAKNIRSDYIFYRNFTPSKKATSPSSISSGLTVSSADVKRCLLNSSFRNKNFHILNDWNLETVWGKLYKRSSIASVQFEEELRLGEDVVFNVMALSSGKVSFSDTIAYFYCEDESMTCRIFRSRDLADSMCLYSHIDLLKCDGNMDEKDSKAYISASYAALVKKAAANSRNSQDVSAYLLAMSRDDLVDAALPFLPSVSLKNRVHNAIFLTFIRLGLMKSLLRVERMISS